ncbi:polyketide synthase dehydratase domain-containing protein, partial [Nocardia beijingensis]|uniref:polyketide synthase dehydratase domain-containing protein n=1 Tax=Nocardia beijingensis TaxID=95162 RepID=UPI00344B7E64
MLIHRGVIGAAVTTLSRDLRDRNNVLRAVADLYVAGSLDGSSVPGRPDSVVAHLDLPAYPWQRKRVWHDEAVTLLDRLGTPDGYALLGEPTTAAGSEWEVQLSVARLPWLRDHVVSGHVVLPGAAYLDAALSAAVERTGRASVGLESVEFVAPLVIDEHDIPVLRVSVEESTKRFRIRSRSATAATWTLNAHGRLIEADFTSAVVDVEAPEHAVAVAGPDLYRGLAARGLDYGPAFQRIVSAVVGADAVVASLAPVEQDASIRHLAHPALVDAALQCIAALAADSDTGVAIVPAAIAGVRLLGPLPQRPRVVVTRRGTDPLRADIALVGEQGEVAMRLLGVEFRPVSAAIEATHQLERVFYQPIWEIVETQTDARATEREVVVAVCVGADAADRAAALLGERTDVTVALADPDAADNDERLRLALRAPDGVPIAERIRVVVVFGDAFDGSRNVYWLA